MSIGGFITLFEVGVVIVLGLELPVFSANHLFIFLIQDDENGLILFMGKVADPNAE